MIVRIGTLFTRLLMWNNACLVALLRVTRTSGWTGSSRSWEKRGSHDWFTRSTTSRARLVCQYACTRYKNRLLEKNETHRGFTPPLFLFQMAFVPCVLPLSLTNKKIPGKKKWIYLPSGWLHFLRGWSAL